MMLSLCLTKFQKCVITIYIYKQKLIFKMDLLNLLIKSLVFSHLLYCLPVWGLSLSDVNVNRLKCL